jgi:hypothetical protein
MISTIDKMRPYAKMAMESLFEKPNKRINVERGCPNKQCFCTGKCKEIVGYWENGNYIDLGKTSLKQ